MKMGKRILAAAVALCLVMGSVICPVSMKEAWAAVFGNYEYELLSGTEIKIIKYTGTDTELEIPGNIGGGTVKEIGDAAFKYNRSLMKVSIPNGVTKIGEGAFCDCRGLKEVNIPSSMDSIGNCAFEYCIGLTEINIPDGVTEIRGGAFNNCTGLTEISLPETISLIDTYAFKDCSNIKHVYYAGTKEQWDKIKIDPDGNDRLLNAGIHYNVDSDSLKDYEYEVLEDNTVRVLKYKGSEKEVEIPETINGRSVSRIAAVSFFDNVLSLIEKVKIPSSVVDISMVPFLNCKELIEINVDENNPSYSSDNGCLYNKDKTELFRCPEGKKGIFALPDGVSSHTGAFSGCAGLTEIIIPSSLNGLDFYFNGCKNLKRFTLPSGVTEINMAAFNDCESLGEITIPDSVKHIYAYAFNGCNSLKDVYYSGSKAQWDEIDIITGTSEGNESNGPLLKAAIHFSDGTMINGSNSNYQYRFLNSDDTGDTIEITKYTGTAQTLTIPSEIDGKRVVSIGQNAFYKCESLTEINIPVSVTSIGTDAFSGCKGLTQVNIPDGVTSIEDGTFANCQSLKKISIPARATSIGTNAFAGCSNLAEISMPDGVSDIGTMAFSGCESLTQIDLPVNLTSMGAGAFMNCKGLTRISIPDGVQSIGDNVFSNCFSLAGINMPDGVTDIGNFAFYACGSLAEIVLPANLTSIGNGAFCQCAGLTEIRIPDGVTSIGDQAFSLCEGLTEINLPDGVASIGSRGFWSCTDLAEISIPASVASIGNEAFENCENLRDVYYSGTEEQWDKIEIGSSNEELLNAVIHFKDVEPKPPLEEVILPTAASAKEELEKLKAGDALSLEKDFQHFLSEEQIDIIESCIYTWLAEINYAYKYTENSGVKERIMKKAGIDPEGNFVSGTEQAITHISVWTKYGPKILEITLGLGKPDANGNLYPSYGEMHYEILEKRGFPSSVPTDGQIGKNSYADMGAFINSTAKSSDDSLHNTFQWQKLSDWMVAGILADKTVSEIIGNKNGCFSDGTFVVYAKPLSAYSKRVTIACPVDVYVYNMDGEEAGSIINNEPNGGNQNVHLDVNGDTKTVYLAGDDYYLNLRGTDTGTMKYEVEEIANEEVQRNVQFLELQLKKDMQYEGYVFRPLNIDSDLYALRTVGSTNQEVFYANEDRQQQALSLFKRVEGLTLGQGSTSMDAGRTVQMSASVSPLDASNPDLQWTTNDESVAKVDSNGMVTAVGAGRATVTVSTKDGSFLKQFCVIDVANKNSSPDAGPDTNPDGSTNVNPGGGTIVNPGGGTSVNPGGSTSVNPGGSTAVNPGNNNQDNITKPPLEQEQGPSIVSLYYVLQFNANGGTGLSRATMTLLAGDCPGIMPKARRKGYTFDGWYTQQEGGTQISGDKPLEEAATLYAQWTKVTAPAKAAAPALKSRKKGQVKVSLKNVAGAAGYQIAYSTSKKFTSAKTKTAGASAKVKTLTGLKAGKKYYVRVRAYKVDSTNSRIYGAYSKVKSIKAKG